MADPLQLPPLPDVGTKPPLTAAIITAAAEAGTPAPGSGGWTPKMLQTIALGCLAAAATAALDLYSAGIVTPKVLLLAAGKGVVAYLVAYFGIRSAGVRQAQ